MIRVVWTKKGTDLFLGYLKARAIGRKNMETNNNTMQSHKPIKAIIICVIGFSGSFALIKSEIIGELSFVSFICISIVSSFIIYFENRITSIGFGKFKATMDSVVAKLTEPKSEPKTKQPIETKKTSLSLSLEAYSTDDETKSVIKAIGNTQYIWRYLDNIVKDSNLSSDTVKDKLNWLIINKLATENKGVDGKVYGLSSKGQYVFSNIIDS